MKDPLLLRITKVVKVLGRKQGSNLSSPRELTSGVRPSLPVSGLVANQVIAREGVVHVRAIRGGGFASAHVLEPLACEAVSLMT
jgi:hypothetical protein